MTTDANVTSASDAKLTDFFKKFGAFVVGVATLVGSVAGALYLVAPQFQPRSELGATVEKIGVTHVVPYGLFQEEQYGIRDTVGDPVDPRQVGIEILVNAKLMAYQDRSYFMKAELHEADSMRQLRPNEEGRVNGSCDGKSPKANTDAATWVCWHASPEAGTKYFVRAVLYDGGPSDRVPIELPEGAEYEDAHLPEALTFADSEIFTVPRYDPADVLYEIPPLKVGENSSERFEMPTAPPCRPADKSS